jgi:hypothetical protein
MYETVGVGRAIGIPGQIFYHLNKKDRQAAPTLCRVFRILTQVAAAWEIIHVSAWEIDMYECQQHRELEFVPSGKE